MSKITIHGLVEMSLEGLIDDEANDIANHVYSLICGLPWFYRLPLMISLQIVEYGSIFITLNRFSQLNSLKRSWYINRILVQVPGVKVLLRLVRTFALLSYSGK